MPPSWHSTRDDRHDDRRYSLLNAAELLWVQERQRATARLLVSLGWLDRQQGAAAWKWAAAAAATCWSSSGLGSDLKICKASNCCRQAPSALEASCPRRWRSLAVMPPGQQAPRSPPRARTSCFSPPSFRRCSMTRFSSGWRIRCGDGCGRAVACCGTTSRSTTPATRTCVASPRAAFASCFLKAGCERSVCTLAPPVARAVTRLHPTLYTVLNTCVWLRTHVLAWVEKPG